MNFVIATCLECLAVVKRNKKWVYYGLFLFMWLLFWGNQTSSDRLEYLYVYRNIQWLEFRTDMEVGFQLVIMLAKRLGLSDTAFFAGYSFVGYYLISHTIMNFSKNPALVLGLYFLFPYLLDAEQLRSFMGMALMVYGSSYLVRGTKKGKLCFVCLCIIAISFQYSCVFFLLFLMGDFSKKYLYLITVLMTIGITAIKKFSGVLIAVLPFLPVDKLLSYISHTNTGSKGFLSVLYFLLGILFFTYIAKKEKRKWKTNEYMFNFYQFVEKINIISVCVLPLIILSDDFTRLSRSIFILNYIVVANAINFKITKWKELGLLLFILLFTGCRFVVYLVGSGYESFIVPFFVEGFKFGGIF